MIKIKSRALVALALASALFTGGVAAAVPAVAAPISVGVRTAAPGAGELQSKLQLVLNPGAPRASRAAQLEAGEAGLPLVDTVGGVMATVPGFQWQVVEPIAVQGDTLTHQLQVNVPGFDAMFIELSWKQIDGTWKLTRESECTIAYYAGQACTV
ncbi:hypothetical protein NDR87_19990 [Nocardia sp. CDC159]|uniref:Low molecular weight antigen MTB12-like C-terminal domain-containing protein n=1 Tax=Nocardia pulmonis TaxID=2951408 RepID=A0A9X2ED31_9NOCA|nr:MULTISPECIES: hypothetical protein [Nocardia]MCM6776023.1 hypothetical protein [Nocardia pulmonis]MCM6788650.1 hypothetical protein [Nocardia sp. CDC159]